MKILRVLLVVGILLPMFIYQPKPLQAQGNCTHYDLTFDQFDWVILSDGGVPQGTWVSGSGIGTIAGGGSFLQKIYVHPVYCYSILLCLGLNCGLAVGSMAQKGV